MAYYRLPPLDLSTRIHLAMQMPDMRESLDELYSRLRQERRAEVKRRIHTLVLMKEGKSGIRKAVAEYFLAYLYHPELDGSGITEVGEKTVD